MLDYTAARNTREDICPANVDTFRGGKLAVHSIVPVLQNEAMTLSISAYNELAPIAGRLISEVREEIISVFVPLLAINELAFPSDEYAANAEVMRDKLASGQALWGMEPEGEITKRAGIEPQPVAGVKKLDKSARLAYIAAVNFLRRQKYELAAQLDNTFDGLAPALLSTTALKRLGGVLNPEDRVNGTFGLTGEMRVQGLGVKNQPGAHTGWLRGADGSTEQVSMLAESATSQLNYVALLQDPDKPTHPKVWVDLASAGQSLSIQDFYRAEQIDKLTRDLRNIVDKNSIYGQDIVSRVVHGLSVETGRQPFVLYQKEQTMRGGMRRAMDGPNLDKEQTDIIGGFDYMIPVPRTEFGGVVVTLVAVKPDETLAHQPHPIFSEPWGGINFAADELAFDPEPVRFRQLDAEAAQIDEETVAMYMGRHHLKRRYVRYGFSGQVDPNTVANKSAIWQLEIPLSVTPENVSYPDDISHYPFADQLGDAVTMTARYRLFGATPLIYGPSPVEELAAIETENVFEDVGA